MNKAKDKILLIDGNALVHRSFHAVPPTFKAPDGTLTNAVYGFFSTLLSAISKFDPKYCLVAFDVSGGTFRDDLFKEYKAKRAKAPQELYDQINVIKTLLDVFEIPHVGVKGFEADDVIGTLAHQSKENYDNLDVIIVTGDQDALQLVNDSVKVFNMKNGTKEVTLMDEAAITSKYGFKPKQMIDYKALRGDPSDNIPGVAGIGDKTACQLLNDYGTIENILAKKNELPEKVSKKIIGQEEIAKLSKELATIITNVPIELDLKRAKLHDFDEVQVGQAFEKLGMFSLIRRMPKSTRGIEPKPIQESLL